MRCHRRAQPHRAIEIGGGQQRAARAERRPEHTGRVVGQCVWWVLNEFHQYDGWYPNTVDPAANNGDARYLDAPNPYVTDTRTFIPASSVRYVLAP